MLTHNPAVVGESDLAEGLVIVDGFRLGGITSDPEVVPDNSTNVDVVAHRKGLVDPKPFAGLGRNTTIDVHTWILE